MAAKQQPVRKRRILLTCEGQKGESSYNYLCLHYLTCAHPETRKSRPHPNKTVTTYNYNDYMPTGEPSGPSAVGLAAHSGVRTVPSATLHLIQWPPPPRDSGLVPGNASVGLPIPVTSVEFFGHSRTYTILRVRLSRVPDGAYDGCSCEEARPSLCAETCENGRNFDDVAETRKAAGVDFDASGCD